MSFNIDRARVHRRFTCAEVIAGKSRPFDPPTCATVSSPSWLDVTCPVCLAWQPYLEIFRRVEEEG